jgi:hypothetical protein
MKRASIFYHPLLMVLAGLVALFSGCGEAQMGPDREAFKAVDALFTAVSLREPVQVARCATTLAELKDEGRLPDSAFEELSAIVERTKAGEWEPAQVRLREFMLGQHR